MSTTPPALPPKKKGPLFWILIGVGVLMLLGVIGIAVTMFFVSRVVSSVADSDNPTFAIAKLALRFQPDLELVSEDPSTGRITVRDKKTGEVSTMIIDPESKTFQFESGNDKASVELEEGRAVLTGKDGTTVITNEGGSMPSWLPPYPGTQPAGNIVAESPEAKNTSYSFKTTDSPEKVLTFYKEQLQRSGFVVPTTMIQPSGGMMIAQDDATKRQVMVTLGDNGEGMVSVTERK